MSSVVYADSCAQLYIFCFFSSVLWFIDLLQTRFSELVNQYLMECLRLCSQTGRLGEFKLNSGKSPVMFCLVPLHPVRNLKTNSSAQAGGALRVPAREQRAPEIRGHLLEMSARRVQSVAAQDRDSHRTADQNQNQDQDRAGFSRSVADVLYNISRFNRVIHEFCAEKRAAVKRPGPLDCRNVFRIAQFSFFA